MVYRMPRLLWQWARAPDLSYLKPEDFAKFYQAKEYPQRNLQRCLSTCLPLVRIRLRRVELGSQSRCPRKVCQTNPLQVRHTKFTTNLPWMPLHMPSNFDED